MLPRTLEPEVMDSPDEAREYDAMDLAAVNSAFVDDLLAALSDLLTQRTEADPLALLDVGTGTAQIPLELARREPRVHVTAVDLSQEMLNIGREHCRRLGMEDRCTLEITDGKVLPYASACFDAVISNSLIHHLPEPGLALAEMLRVLRPEGLLFLRDLFRPDSEKDVNDLVERHAGGETPRQRSLFRDSLHAALTLAEIQGLLEEVGLPVAAARLSSDRHWTICFSRGGKPQARTDWHK